MYPVLREGGSMMLLRILISIIVVYGTIACEGTSTPPPNKLWKVFHHRVEAEPGAVPFLELGKIIFNFSSEPQIDLVNNGVVGTGTFWKRTFFFPATEVASDECKEMLQSIAQNKANSFYRVEFEIVDKPVKGLRFIVTYDHEKVGMTYAVLESTESHKRLIVTFYDKSQIKRIKSTQESVLRTACQHKPGVIVDIGHGGSDSGAQGCFNLTEKDINLEVGMYVANLLRKKGFEVFLTRSTDICIALDERTVMTASNKAAAVFISIHTNAASNINAAGIETFFFDVSRYCKGQDKPSRLTTALLHDRCEKSRLLANSIHQSVLEYAKHKHHEVIDRTVKESFLQVLVGSAVPSALVELGFLTNEQEATLMQDKHYKMLLAVGICEGIVRYFEHV
jgi:N-acetylmuramoyl-L-alanine amidase